MEQVRHTRLDNYCRTIAECRETSNQAKADEAASCQAAQTYMHDNRVSAYSQNGVELVLVPGAEKLRVRLVDMTSRTTAAPSGDDVAGEAAGGENPDPEGEQ